MDPAAEHRSPTMGLLDSDDSTIKNHLKYKNLLKARQQLDEDVEFFKAKGGTSGLVQRPASTCLRVEREHGNLKKQFPDFAGGDEHLDFAKAVAKALLEKYPTHTWTGKIKHLTE